MVEVEDHKAEPTVVTMTESLDVILGPFVITQVQFYGHIINVLVNIQQVRTYFIVCHRIGGILRQGQQFIEGIGRSAHLHIVRVGRTLSTPIY